MVVAAARGRTAGAIPLWLTAALLVAALARQVSGDTMCPPRMFVCSGPRTRDEFLAQRAAPGVYDRAMSPNQACGSAAPVTVEVQFHLVHLDKIDQVHSQVRVGGYLRVWWKDSRLAYNTTAQGGCFDDISMQPDFKPEKTLWTPNIYIDNAVSQTVQTTLCDISPDGSIWVSQMVQLTFNTKMNFQRMPFDSHILNIDVGSYSLKNSIVRVVPKGLQPGVRKGGEGMTSEQLDSPMWLIQEGEAEKEGGMKTPGLWEARFNGKWDYAVLRFKISRKPRFFLLQVLMQDGLFLFVSYSAFFVNPANAPARAAMAVMPVLIMRTLQNSVFQGLPQLSYKVWLVDYLMISMWLCVLCVGQFAITQAFLLHEARCHAYFDKLQATSDEMYKIIATARSRKMTTLELLKTFQTADTPDGLVANWNYKEEMPRETKREAEDSGPPQTTTVVVEDKEMGKETKREGVDSGPPQTNVLEDKEDEKFEGDDIRPMRRRRSVGQDTITEATFGVVQNAFHQFRKFDYDDSGALAPAEIRRLLLSFNIHMTLKDCAEATCKFLRDKGCLSPKDPLKAQLRMGEFLEFLYDIDDYLIGVPHHMKTPFSRSLPPSRRMDIGAQWFFPIIVLVKMAIFFAIIPSYESSIE